MAALSWQRWRPTVLRVWRAAVVVALAWLVHRSARLAEPAAVSLAQAREFFPQAASFGPADRERGGHVVFDAAGQPCGHVLTTAPHTDDLRGYSGPANVLVARGTDGAVLGTRLLESGDSPDHVAKVAAATRFWDSFKNWQPATNPAPAFEAVSGATLTSAAVHESIVRRLTGSAPSVRFPDGGTLAEARQLFPTAATLEGDRVFDGSGALIGRLARTSPAADGVTGYAGPTECLVALSPDGQTVLNVTLRTSFDTPSYVDQVREDPTYLSSFRGRTARELAAMDFAREGLEGVSGATQTSWAVAEGLKRHFSAVGLPAAAPWRPAAHDWALGAVIAGACTMAFTRLRGKKAVRVAWQALVIGWVGLVAADLLSQSLLYGWLAHGVAWRSAPALLALATAAVLLPWATGRNVYCHHLCPHGALQQWLGRLPTRKRSLPRWLEHVPAVLAAVIALGVVARWKVEPSRLEPFDAWSWRAAGEVAVGLAAAGLLASAWIPQAYCRYGCPTGWWFAFLRSAGSADRFQRRDAQGLALLSLAALAAAWPASQPASPGPLRLGGATMGTTWSASVHDAPVPAAELRTEIQRVFDSAEATFSTWRPDSELSRLNAAPAGRPVALSPEMRAVLERSAALVEASGGAFDPTVGALVDAWGFGPRGAAAAPPAAGAETIATLRATCGWQHVSLGPEGLVRHRAETKLDLSAIAKGHALDRVAEHLLTLGCRSFVVEAGGELRAEGEHAVEIEHPARAVTLRGGALATSGTYAQQHTQDDRTWSHVIDPRTGEPTHHRTTGVSVRAADCATADAWTTALLVLGADEGLRVSDQLGLAAQFAETCEIGGNPTLRSSAAW